MKDITIKNFRCYEEKSMTFRRGINLLIGDNSVGKTSLLRACNLVINAFFSGYSDENTSWKSAEDDDFREIASSETLSGEDLPISITFHLSDEDLPDISMSDGSTYHTHWDGEDLMILKKSKKNARNLVTGLRALKEYGATLQANSIMVANGTATQLNALPLYAYYTTEDIHTIRKFDKEKSNFKKYPQKPSFGYFVNFDCKGLLDCWVKRLLVLREARKGEEEIGNVRNAIRRALGPDGCGIINDIEIRQNDGEIIYILNDGREVKTDLLSDGYRRLVSIVTDTAIRCALLNKTIYGQDAYKLTRGTVIIDEIDEHLHPALQVRVLKALAGTFENLQFIVSTHSPLVISSVESNDRNVVYKLAYDNQSRTYSHRELNTYGLDASSIITAYMDQAARDIDVENKLNAIREHIDNEQLDQALKLLVSLQRATGTNDPEFTHLETMISFLKDDYDTDKEEK